MSEGNCSCGNCCCCCAYLKQPWWVTMGYALPAGFQGQRSPAAPSAPVASQPPVQTQPPPSDGVKQPPVQTQPLPSDDVQQPPVQTQPPPSDDVQQPPAQTQPPPSDTPGSQAPDVATIAITPNSVTSNGDVIDVHVTLTRLAPLG